MPRRLKKILSWEEERVVQRDWTVQPAGQWYQLDRQHEALSLAGKKVTARRLRDGRVQLERGGMKLKWRTLAGRPVRTPVKSVAPVRRAAVGQKPAATHPWRVQRIGSARGRGARRRMERLGVPDSGLLGTEREHG